MRRGGRTREDGFVREVLWVTLVVLIGAVAVLDAVSLYSAYERVRKDTSDAARQARQTYVQELDVGKAEQAARKLLESRGDTLTALATEDRGDTPVFVASATRRVETYAFRYLSYLPGLDAWVERTMNPSATGRSD